MPIGAILALGVSHLDRESLMQLILHEDRARRACERARDGECAARHEAERDLLITQWEKLL